MDVFLERTVFESGTQLAVALVVLLGAQAIYALYGFGSGLLSVALLAFVFSDLSSVVTLLLLVNLPTEIFVVLKDGERVRWRESGLLLLSLAVAIPAGAALLRAGVGQRWLVLLLGALLLVFSAHFLLLDRARTAAALPPFAPAVAGAASGVLAGLFGTGGPPLILYYRLRGLPKRDFRAALLAVFLATSVVRIPTYFAIGLAGVSTIYSAILVLPASLVGLAIGQRLHRGIGETSFRRGTAVALGILGILLLLRS